MRIITGPLSQHSRNDKRKKKSLHMAETPKKFVAKHRPHSFGMDVCFKIVRTPQRHAESPPVMKIMIN